jgi:hypothetical protein
MNTETTKRTKEAISAEATIKVQELADLVYEHFSNVYEGKTKTDYNSAESAEIAEVLKCIGTSIQLRFWLGGKD